MPSTLNLALLAVEPIPTAPFSIVTDELPEPILTVSVGPQAVVAIPILSKLPSLIRALALIAPNGAQLLSVVNTQPVVPPRGGLWL